MIIDKKLEPLTTDSVKVILTHYKRNNIMGRYLVGHETLRFKKNFITPDDVANAYFCEKKVHIEYLNAKNNDIIQTTDAVILKDLNLSYHMCAEVNGIFIIGKMPQEHSIDVDSSVIRLQLNKYGIMYNEKYVNMEDEVLARTYCYCMDTAFKQIGYKGYEIEYVVNYRDCNDNRVIKCFSYAYDVAKKIKARNDVDFVVDYWIESRDFKESKLPMKHNMCEYKIKCGYDK